MQPEATRAAISQHGRVCLKGEWDTGAVKGNQAGTRALLDQQTLYVTFFVKCERGALARCRGEGPLDLGSGGVAAGMQDAPATMCGFTTQQKTIGGGVFVAARTSAIKARTHLNQPT